MFYFVFAVFFYRLFNFCHFYGVYILRVLYFVIGFDLAKYIVKPIKFTWFCMSYFTNDNIFTCQRQPNIPLFGFGFQSHYWTLQVIKQCVSL